MDLSIEAPRQLVSRQSTASASLSPGEVLVRVNRISLCGSDYRLYEGTYGGPKNYPIHFGHEWAGHVIEAPRGSRFSPGDRVTGDCSKWCGGCEACEWDKNICRNIQKFGITVDGFSMSVRAVNEKYLYADALGLQSELLALTELFAVARHGVRAAESRLGRDTAVLVVGSGAVGLATYLILRRGLGLDNVFLAEAKQAKIASVRGRIADCQFAENLPTGPWDRAFTYPEITSAAKYPVVFECSGGSGALNTALMTCAMGGLVICLGLNPVCSVRTDLIVTKRLAIRGSIGGTGEFESAMQFLAEHRDSAAALITHEFAAAEARAAFEQTLDCTDRIKTQLVF